MFRRFVDSMSSFFAWLKRKQRVKLDLEPVKVNIGSGLSVAEGWINVDASLNAFFSKYPRIVLKLLYRLSGAHQWYSQEEYIEKLRNHTFVHHKLEYGIPFPDNTIDYLYSSHLLEHLFRDEAERVLRDAYRTLKKGGRIRICVPGLEYAFALYQVGDKDKALSYFFSGSKAGSLGQHHYMYDFDLLKKLLETVGFVDVEQCSFQEGKTPDIHKIDNRPEETLFVEARKPAENFT